MAILSAASTYDQVTASYDDNASYAAPTKAAAFITAARILMRRMPAELGDQVSKTRLDENLRAIASELTATQRWLTANTRSQTAPSSRLFVTSSPQAPPLNR